MPFSRFPSKRFDDGDEDEYDEFDLYDDDFISEPNEDAFLGYTTPQDAIIVEGPIRATSKQNKFGATWWGKRWIALLDEVQGDSRLERARTYARNGYVTRLEIGKGIVYARVRGSRPRPYETGFKLPTLTDEMWGAVLDALSSQLIFTAKLLAGEMPAEIETLLAGHRPSLFPASLDEIKFKCTCPDYADPCKHAAAVFYVMSEQIDHNPLLLFHLRGRTQPQVLEALRALRSDSGKSSSASSALALPKALDADLEQFWRSSTPLPRITAPTVPEVPAIFRDLGTPPLSELELRELTALYRAMSEAALKLINLDRDDPRDDPPEAMP
jgi:uncharacterized Zn finger protein